MQDSLLQNGHFTSDGHCFRNRNIIGCEELQEIWQRNFQVIIMRFHELRMLGEVEGRYI